MNYTAIEVGQIADIATFSSPTKVDLSPMRGDSLSAIFRLYREVDDCGDGHSAQTLTGLTGRATVRPAPDHPLSYALTVTVDTAAGSGRVTISATDTQTRLMPETGVWDLELTNGAGVRKTIVRGTWRMTRDAAF